MTSMPSTLAIRIVGNPINLFSNANTTGPSAGIHARARLPFPDRGQSVRRTLRVIAPGRRRAARAIKEFERAIDDNASQHRPIGKATVGSRRRTPGELEIEIVGVFGASARTDLPTIRRSQVRSCEDE